MPIFKVIRWETSSQTAFVQADSVESAEEAARYIDSWEENQDITFEYDAEPADPTEYKPAQVHKV
jgi:hypothetical protein